MPPAGAHCRLRANGGAQRATEDRREDVQRTGRAKEVSFNRPQGGAGRPHDAPQAPVRRGAVPNHDEVIHRLHSAGSVDQE